MLLVDSTMSPTSSIANLCLWRDSVVEREADEDLGKSSGYSRIAFLELAGAALAAGIAWSLSQSSSLENSVSCCLRYLLEGHIKLVVRQSVRRVDFCLRQTSLGLAGKLEDVLVCS